MAGESHRKDRQVGYNEGSMRVISGDAALESHDLVLTIGAFDGVHCGHQALLRALVQQARRKGMLAAVLTFNPHPREVLQPGIPFRYLTTDAERAHLLEAIGIDLLILQQFDRNLAATPAGEFVLWLCEQLHMRQLWTGPDFALGHDRQGDVAELGRLAAELGFELHVIQRAEHGDQVISSTRIRTLLKDGAVREATALLGRHYGVGSVVRHGAQRGRRLGILTANLRIGPWCCCPADGVYAVWGKTPVGWQPGVANLGRRPSFDLGERLLEVHLMDYEGSLYGQHMRVLFVERLRAEHRFDDPDALVAQVCHDVEHAREVLSVHPPMDLTLCPPEASAS